MADTRAALEGSIRRQDRLAALGKAVAGVAHEIRNPLKSMRLSLELTQRRLQSGGGSGDAVAGAIEEVDRLDAIVTRLLTFGNPGAESRQTQDLRPIVARVVRILEPQSATRKVRMNLDLSSEPLLATVDAGEIEQVLINIVLNGIDVSPAGSAVGITTHAAQNQIEMSIRDSGSGVPPCRAS